MEERLEEIFKTCTKCGERKLFSEFYKRKNGKLGRSSRCAKCRKDYMKQYYKDHHQEIREQKKQYYKDHCEEIKEHHKDRNEEIKEYMRQYRKRCYEERKRYMNQYMKQYRQTSQWRLCNRLHNLRRRAQKRHAGGGGITKAQIGHLLKIQKNKCNICGKRFMKSYWYTIDHIIPLAAGGIHDSNNMQLLCRSCNSSKQAKLDYTFIQTWVVRK